jgi:xylan 1,4-beta-xylosidase
MSVLPRKGQYEFYNVDQVFDYLLEIGVRPIVELSFTPSAMVSSCKGSEKKCDYAFDDRGGYKGLTMPPDDFDEWRALIQALGEHLVDRYGLDEVTAWHFEVWNEMWGVDFPNPYMQLYNASSFALKAISPGLFRYNIHNVILHSILCFYCPFRSQGWRTCHSTNPVCGRISQGLQRPGHPC